MNWRLRKKPASPLGEAARAKREPDRAKPQEGRVRVSRFDETCDPHPELLFAAAFGRSLELPVAEDDNSGSGACAPVFNVVRPLLYQAVGSDPEFRKRVHRRLTHFCHGLLGTPPRNLAILPRMYQARAW